MNSWGRNRAARGAGGQRARGKDCHVQGQLLARQEWSRLQEERVGSRWGMVALRGSPQMMEALGGENFRGYSRGDPHDLLPNTHTPINPPRLPVCAQHFQGPLHPCISAVCSSYNMAQVSPDARFLQTGWAVQAWASAPCKMLPVAHQLLQRLCPSPALCWWLKTLSLQNSWRTPVGTN